MEIPLTQKTFEEMWSGCVHSSKAQQTQAAIQARRHSMAWRSGIQGLLMTRAARQHHAIFPKGGGKQPCNRARRKWDLDFLDCDRSVAFGD
jgi:hypothetical protein